MPAGSAWVQNPVPRENAGFAPHCLDPAMCAGNRPAASGSLLIVDRVGIPKGLPDGEYVLGWRWDCASPLRPPSSLCCSGLCCCVSSPPHSQAAALSGAGEESNQIWQSCSDVTINRNL